MWSSLAIMAVLLLARDTAGQEGWMDLNPGFYRLHWICIPPHNITFTVEVNAPGWIGFGISPDGEMLASDVVILFPNDTFGDYHTDDTRRIAPVRDTEQNWNIQSSSVMNGSRVATFSRDLVTGDPGEGESLDLDIPVGAPVNLIYAWRNTADNEFVFHDTRGFVLGVELCREPSSPSPTPLPTPTPSASPPPTSPSITETTTSSPADSPTPQPTVFPTPSPTPEPNCTLECINMEILDPNTCECKCFLRSYPCPFNEVFNRDICSCERRPDCPEVTNQTCPNGEVFSLATCSCVPRCNLTCDFPKRLDANACSCVCPPGILPRGAKCPPPLEFDEDSCLCRCGLDPSECTGNQVLNLATCSCGCENVTSCPGGQSFDESLCRCRCENVTSCPGGQSFDESLCRCRCENVTSCPGGQSFDESLCRCRCDKEEECCEGRVFNMDTCRCECNGELNCSAGEIVNPKTCECECEALSSEALWYKEFAKCWRQNYKVFNIFSCGCECPKFLTCPEGKVINPNTCRCECPPRPPSCSHPKTYDSRSCKCYCPRRLYCGHGKVFNEATCQCECRPQHCTHGKWFNRNTCSCECSSHGGCPSGQYWDWNQCRCYCPYRTCPYGQRLNTQSCQCQCRQIYPCPSGRNWDSNKCQCVCTPKPCPANKGWNSHSCSCQCSHYTQRCSPGYSYSPSSCTCQCTRTCGAHETLDRSLCKCKRIQPTTPPRPPTTTSPPSPPHSCSRLPSQHYCKLSHYYRLSCKWYHGRCVPHCCQLKSSRYRRTYSVTRPLVSCQSYSRHHCDNSPYCSWTC